MKIAAQQNISALKKTIFNSETHSRIKKTRNGKLTVLVPAYNEAESIGDTIVSLQQQTFPIHEIIVIDDVSTDNTADIASLYRVRVIKPPKNTGSKAGAQNYAMQFVNTEFTMAIDADTILAHDAVEKLIEAFEDENVVAACGFVLPRHVRTVWERGRYVEYLFAFSFYKQIQDYFGKPLISSGCFSLYRTEILKENGCWSMRTLAEDMDLTWSLYQKGYGVRFIPEAVCYPIEPHNYLFMKKQLKRWSHGFVQNVRLHWKGVQKVKYLNHIITVVLWDAIIASCAYLILLPIMAILFRNPIFLIGYIIDIPAIIVPTMFVAIRRKEFIKLLISLPSFFVLRTVNAIFMIEAFWTEVVMKKTFKTYEKGH
ncbi:glycosyltransferase [Candidatus Omnitrophota bacterium]